MGSTETGDADDQTAASDAASEGVACTVRPSTVDPPTWKRPLECFFCREIVEGIEASEKGWTPRRDRGRFGFIEAWPDFVARRNDDGSFMGAPRWTWVYHPECLKRHNPPGLEEYGTPDTW